MSKSTPKAKTHHHCWHVTSSTTNGLAIKGWDDMRCCFCGVSGRREWHSELDPRHGAFAPISGLVYGEVKKR